MYHYWPLELAKPANSAEVAEVAEAVEAVEAVCYIAPSSSGGGVAYTFLTFFFLLTITFLHNKYHRKSRFI